MTREDISYDFEDFVMTAEQLQAKYSDSAIHEDGHPEYTKTQWQTYKDMPTRDVKLDYWDWVARRISDDDINISSNDTEGNPIPEAKSEMVTFESIDLFAAHLVAWHRRQIAKLNHMLSIPSGVEFQVKIGDEEERTMILEGDVLQAFRGGVATALTELDKLPFAVLPVEPAADVPGEPDGTGG